MITVPPQVGDPASWGELRAKTVQWHDPLPTAAVGKQMTRLEYLSAMHRGDLPQSPIARLIGLKGDGASPGEIRFRCTPDDSTYNPVGLVHGGLVATILDSGAGCAVHTLLEAGVGYASADLKVSFLRPAPAGVELRARGWSPSSAVRRRSLRPTCATTRTASSPPPAAPSPSSRREATPIGLNHSRARRACQSGHMDLPGRGRQGPGRAGRPSRDRAAPAAGHRRGLAAPVTS